MDMFADEGRGREFDQPCTRYLGGTWSLSCDLSLNGGDAVSLTTGQSFVKSRSILFNHHLLGHGTQMNDRSARLLYLRWLERKLGTPLRRQNLSLKPYSMERR